MTAPAYPRSAPNLCIRCRKVFERGDRVQIVHIVSSVGKNPDNPMQMGAWLSAEFELAHVECADRGLEGVVIK